MSISNHEGENDSELLLWAAKAIGATEYQGPDDCRGPGVVLLNGEPVNYEGSGEFGYPWNPLQDDGDAFRLLVALPSLWDLRLQFGPYWRLTVAWGTEGPRSDIIKGRTCSHERAAGLRRVTVEAAAEIGRRMP